MVFVNSNGPLPAMGMAFPDVCLTPVVVPVPVPYPNITLSTVAIPDQFVVLLECMPAHNLATETPISLGDTPGVLLGVLSGMVMGPQRHLTSSFTLFLGGPPATKMLDMTGQNGLSPNDPGISLSPSQVTVLALS